MRRIKVVSKVLSATAVSSISACAVVPHHVVMMMPLKIWLTQLLTVQYLIV